MARKAFGLALLMTVGLGGCSFLKGNQEAQDADAKMVALRARTDSLRKARHAADSLAQIRYTACADSVRAAMTKPPVVKVKKKKQRVGAPPSEEMIVTRVQTACAGGASAPPTTVAAAEAPKPAVAASEPPAAPAQPDSTLLVARNAAWADSVRKAREVEMSRETFAYSGAARDPFTSLLNIASSGPELNDLQLVGIYQNLRAPLGSVAVFREKKGGKRHKLRTGEQVGRSRLVQIREREVVFTIEDFGFERQETLSLRKQEDVTP